MSHWAAEHYVLQGGRRSPESGKWVPLQWCSEAQTPTPTGSVLNRIPRNADSWVLNGEGAPRRAAIRPVDAAVPTFARRHGREDARAFPRYGRRRSEAGEPPERYGLDLNSRTSRDHTCREPESGSTSVGRGQAAHADQAGSRGIVTRMRPSFRVGGIEPDGSACSPTTRRQSARPRTRAVPAFGTSLERLEHPDRVGGRYADSVVLDDDDVRVIRRRWRTVTRGDRSSER